MKQAGKTLLRYLLLVFIWLALNLIDFYHLQLIYTPQRELLGRFLMVMVDVFALVLLLSRCRLRGWRLIFVVFLALFGLKTFLTVIEAVYLPVLVPLTGPLMVNGLISSLIIVVASIFILGLYDQGDQVNNHPSRIEMNWYHWLWKLPLTSFFWMFLFALFGALVFLNIANWLDPVGLSNYSNLNMPTWVLPFQGFRAMLWLLLTLPLLAQLSGPKKQLVWLIGVVMACWMGSNLLAAGSFSLGLQVAHLVEVTGETFVFGAWLTLLFVRPERLTQNQNDQIQQSVPMNQSI
ncbi:MAG: hypothetical protein CL609_04065 [Anaerolineaceae bacterium]|nr:hypothetical protein [Anaerolineaceae bacterium]